MVQLLSFGLAIISTLALTSYVDAAPRSCVVSQSKTDDSITIVQALNDCRCGGTVVFPKDKPYYIKNMMKIEKLKDVYIDSKEKVKMSTCLAEVLSSVMVKLGGDAKDVTAHTVLRTTLKCSQFGHFKILNSHRDHMGITSA
ncbi:hypothetical protein HPULCUR_001722 [Helicostylum pulchrum]|uniref:Uncharacterized protein n=1 Tax=Helicostylum pulchrum TaxID=562976 RepID=A0ABP9XNI1_9FUNG